MAARPKKRYDDHGKRIWNTTIKVRLHPTPTQAEFFDKSFGCCRYLWNQMLADEQRFYRETGEHFIPTPARYKKQAPFLKEVDSLALSTVHQNLRRAFQKFFEQPETYRHPTFKKKKDDRGSYTIYCQYYASGKGSSIYLTQTGIRLPKVGVVRAAFHRRPLHWWTLKTATITRTATGRYDCSLMFEYAQKEPQPAAPTAETTLGLQYSMSRFYVDSNGYSPNPPHWLRQSQEKLNRMHRRLARMEKDSKNYREQMHKLRKLHEHIANQRKDFIHQESRRIANVWDAVCVGDLDLKQMAQTLSMGNVMDTGFGLFRVALQYKLERMGKAYVVVEKFYPAAKKCHVCGCVLEDLPLRQRVWQCPNCGTIHQRSVNAAINLRDRGLEQYQKTA